MEQRHPAAFSDGNDPPRLSTKGAFGLRRETTEASYGSPAVNGRRRLSREGPSTRKRKTRVGSAPSRDGVPPRRKGPTLCREGCGRRRRASSRRCARRRAGSDGRTHVRGGGEVLLPNNRAGVRLSAERKRKAGPKVQTRRDDDRRRTSDKERWDSQARRRRDIGTETRVSESPTTDVRATRREKTGREMTVSLPRRGDASARPRRKGVSQTRLHIAERRYYIPPKAVDEKRKRTARRFFDRLRRERGGRKKKGNVG